MSAGDTTDHLGETGVGHDRLIGDPTTKSEGAADPAKDHLRDAGELLRDALQRSVPRHRRSVDS
jgi:hypothetical protein